MCGLSRNYLLELSQKGQFPPRVRVRTSDEDQGGRWQFIAFEVRAWADGEDWRAIVSRRLAREVHHAS